jgi:large conductance mechanosensitive channel
MGLLREFRDFALKGNVLDLAVGVIIGAAFGSVVNSLVQDVLMPPIGWLSGGIDFADKQLVIQAASRTVEGGKEVVKPEVALSYGLFINAVIKFLIQAAAIFIVVKLFNEAKKRLELEKAAPAAPPGPTLDQKLLIEIRDLLSKR